MFLKKICFGYMLPIVIAVLITSIILKHNPKNLESKTLSPQAIKNVNYIDKFYPNSLNEQFAFSLALKKSIPIIMGSSELTSNHLEALPKNFFNNQQTFSIGHAGFQSFAILTALAANKPLLKNAKLTIILSPGWFEKQYCSGTSLTSFFEFCPSNYLYQIYKDTTIDVEIKKYISNYICINYDKISRPNAVIRAMGKKTVLQTGNYLNYPFNFIDTKEIDYLQQVDFDLISQQFIINQLQNKTTHPFYFKNRLVNWDSLNIEAKQQFKLISNTNSIAVSNTYYDAWLKNKPKKVLHFVEKQNNQEFKDFEALVKFLQSTPCKVQFVIMPLNTLAHENLADIQPTVNDINSVLNTAHFKVLDMFTPNVLNYETGILEDIMHPYNIGWYKIDKFILDNFNDDRN